MSVSGTATRATHASASATAPAQPPSADTQSRRRDFRWRGPPARPPSANVGASTWGKLANTAALLALAAHSPPRELAHCVSPSDHSHRRCAHLLARHAHAHCVSTSSAGTACTAGTTGAQRAARAAHCVSPSNHAHHARSTLHAQAHAPACLRALRALRCVRTTHCVRCGSYPNPSDESCSRQSRRRFLWDRRKAQRRTRPPRSRWTAKRFGTLRRPSRRAQRRSRPSAVATHTTAEAATFAAC